MLDHIHGYGLVEPREKMKDKGRTNQARMFMYERNVSRFVYL